MRKGYRAEYLAKKKLISEYGEENVIKIAIGGAQDYIVLKPNKNEIEMIIEIKECHKKKYYPRENEIYQFKRIVNLCKQHKIPGFVWIKFPRREWVIMKIGDMININSI